MNTLAEQLNHDGYAVFGSNGLKRNVLAARQDIEDLITDIASVTSQSLEESLIGFFEAATTESYLAFVRAIPKLRSVRNCLYDNHIDTILRDQIGMRTPLETGALVIHLQGERIRIPGGYFGTPPHQDQTAFGTVPSLYTIWLPLTDVNAYDHPLEFAPGSHRHGILEYEPANQVNKIVDKRVTEEMYTAVPVGIGEALVFDGHIAHRSGGGTKNTIRIAVSYRVSEASNADFFARGYTYLDHGAAKREKQN